MRSITILAIGCLLFAAADAGAQSRGLRPTARRAFKPITNLARPAVQRVKPAIRRAYKAAKSYGQIVVVDNFRDSKQSLLRRRCFNRTKLGRGAAVGLAGLQTAFTATMASFILGTGYLTFKPAVNLRRRLKGKRPMTYAEILHGDNRRD